MKGRGWDLTIILIWPVLAAIISLALKPPAIASVLLFLIIPSIYLSFKGKIYVKKVFFFSLVISILTMIFIDYIAHLTGDWLVPSTVFSFRIFGLIPLEDILWAFFSVYFILIFYEYFVNKHKDKIPLHPKMIYLFSFILFIFIIFLFLLFNNPNLLNIPYFYFWWGLILFVIPVSLHFFTKTKVISKSFVVFAYFFYMHFIYEITALKLGWWSFPGEYLGNILILGVVFPIEEVLFWFLLFALALLSYYEFFNDDMK